jgi:hypothetical protein
VGGVYWGLAALYILVVPRLRHVDGGFFDAAHLWQAVGVSVGATFISGLVWRRSADARFGTVATVVTNAAGAGLPIVGSLAFQHFVTGWWG